MMNIDTVIVPDYTSPEEYVKDLYPPEEHRQLGAGMFAYVFAPKKNKDEVIKITSGHDDGYRGWIETVIQLGGNNPYLPRIYEATLYKWDDKSDHYPLKGDTYNHYMNKLVVRMERLRPVRYEYRNRRAIGYGDLINDLIYDETMRLGMKKADRQELLLLLRICHETYGGTIDLHWGNYMFRKGGQVVITDPFS